MAVAERALAPIQKQDASIIQSVDLSTVSQTMEKIARFQAVVQRALKEGHDYGKVPKAEKPSLLKPGAEKIVMLLGLRSEFEIVDSTRDWEKGFFQYQVRCRLLKGDTVITEGLGAANTRERRYARGDQDPYTLDNTVLKMAKKRALVDAALLVASLSDVFTQDVEDMDEPTPPEARSPHEPATEAQRKKLYIASKEHGLDADAMHQILRGRYGVESSKDLTKRQASELIDAIERGDFDPATAGAEEVEIEGAE
ncbi:MAG: hypothetical protein QJR08_04190 [Bacillota bacterium]|nr:hypothetical protein [Bacillota bacterium]